ncbi:putative methyltransferase DDB_G0268948 [Dendrobium catenatum]|uniref:Prenylcysteine oxidase / farnesylcysteine lyase n=1 Tax=Dendrobium catenatum TaxID=906689 RepID=A0A2I0WH49_9ASPA|nr:putative methyltransferase DDB_G0268948 [Dendrobium catenatum]PKU74987.1 prenylcysteine oxidase / farnesylcysteine lyase [Dendrobium catenatum]
MAGLFEEQSELYASARPNYSTEWYAKFASLTTHHKLAWDVGTGNGQAALGVAEHYEKVIATDISAAQLRVATPHPNIQYIHTPISTPPDGLFPLLGIDVGSVDLITVAQAIHWFDLPLFFSVASRALRKPGGVIVIWGYNDVSVSPVFDAAFRRFHSTTLPFWDSRIRYLFDAYRSLPFPFEGVGLGFEGEPKLLDLEKEVSFEGLMAMVWSWSAILTAKERGVDLLDDSVVGELKEAWGDQFVRKVIYKAFMLAGKPRSEVYS